MAGQEKPSVDSTTPKLKGFDDYDVRLGDVMRGERATLGKSLLDVQRDLKIKAAYIAAIENSDPTAFDTQGFVAGYVRSYARYLGMDPEWTFEVFCNESGFSTAHGMSKDASSQTQAARKDATARRTAAADDPFVNPTAPFLPKTSSALAEIEPKAVASIAVLAALVGGIGYGAWAVLEEIQKVRMTPVAQTPGVTATIDPLQPRTGLVEDATDVAISQTETEEALDRLYRPKALDLPVLVARDGPISAVDPDSVGALAGLVPAAPVLDTSPSEQLPPEMRASQARIAGVTGAIPAAGAAGVQVLADVPPEVILFAVRPAWVRVQASDGTVLFEKILDAGERYTVPQSEVPPQLRAGNSGSVYLEVAGNPYGPVGSSASVAKNVVLGVDAVREVYRIADVASDPALEQYVAEAAAAAESRTLSSD
ncbi:MAG: helix-turn-helix domain-containing protein [Pseudomonadota bacterium]